MTIINSVATEKINYQSKGPFEGLVQPGPARHIYRWKHYSD